MTRPKPRMIGADHPGAERYAALVEERYNLGTLRGMTAADFLAAVEPFASRAAYDRWAAVYRANVGTFLDHPVWGADRRIGPGAYLHGAMDDRFASNAARLFGAPAGLRHEHVAGKACALVGAWDGTEALLLHALGARRVVCVEEVPDFAAMARTQLRAWQVPGEVRTCSLYEIDPTEDEWWQAFDLVYVPGVLYHLTDLPLAAVILWSMLRPGGAVAIESIADPPGPCSARYLGAAVPGWNWWAPTCTAYEALLRDAGFPDARTAEYSRGRGWWCGTRGERLPALESAAAGFSRPDLLRRIRGLVAR